MKFWLFLKETYFVGYALQYYSSKKLSPEKSVQDSTVEGAASTHYFFDPEKSRSNILVVIHESELGGATITGLNLVKHLSKEYNVTIFLLDSRGPMLRPILESGAFRVVASNVRGNVGAAHQILEDLLKDYYFTFSIINSLESSILVLPILTKHKVLAINLIHEFSSCYVNAISIWRFMTDWAGIFVFSSSLTRDDAFQYSQDLWNRKVFVIPQGKSDPNINPLTNKYELNSLEKLMRPIDSSKKYTVIVGLGPVHFRKGVDLFIQVAAKIKEIDPDTNYRFIWFGKNYEENCNWGYSAIIKDQIKRSGLDDNFIITGETNNINYVYQNMDILALTSRLDPLPNVALDALEQGKPVVCFDKTTGIAEYLMNDDLFDSCVSPYLDVNDMAKKIVELATNSSRLDYVSKRSKEINNKHFRFDVYVKNIINLVDCCKQSYSADYRELQKSIDSIDKEYYLSHRFIEACKIFNPRSIDDLNENYLRTWSEGRLLRKPIPEFNPAIYWEDNPGLGLQDPYSHYLSKGMPAGRWKSPLIKPQKEAISNLPKSTEVAIHLHVHYPEILPEFLQCLSHNLISPDIYISVTSEEVRSKVHTIMQSYSGSVPIIKVYENKGRDIYPMICGEIACEIFSKYKFVGHFHTKRSTHVESSLGEEWRKFIFANLIGDTNNPMADTVLSNLNSNDELGLVFPSDPNVIGWTDNHTISIEYAYKLGIKNLPNKFNFPVGTMFWAKCKALRPLIDLNLSTSDFPEEPLPIDGTMLHAIERLLPFIVENEGFKYALAYVPGTTR